MIMMTVLLKICTCSDEVKAAQTVGQSSSRWASSFVWRRRWRICWG